MSLVLLRPTVLQYVRDTGSVLEVPADYDRHLRDAVLRYSRRRPRTYVRDLVGDGGFDLVLPEEWNAAFSSLGRVEYPVGQRRPHCLDAREYEVYLSPAGPVLRLLEATPAAGEVVRITITAPHSISEEETSVPAIDHDTIVYLAAGLACQALASHYTNSGNPTVLADTVDYESKGKEFAARANSFLRLAAQELPELDATAGTAVRAAAGETSFAREMDFLTHP